MDSYLNIFIWLLSSSAQMPLTQMSIFPGHPSHNALKESWALASSSLSHLLFKISCYIAVLQVPYGSSYALKKYSVTKPIKITHLNLIA